MVRIIYNCFYLIINVSGDNMKNIKYLIIVFLLFIGINNVLAFDNTVKVYDYAQVLPEKKEQELKEEVNNYINKYNVDMVIVTVKYYKQIKLEDYMNLFYNQNEFGKGINKDGIILVIDLKENNNTVGIKTYGKAKNLYSENEIKNIINNVNGEKKYYNKLFSFIRYSNKYISESDSNYNIVNKSKSHINWLEIILPSLVISAMGVVIVLFKKRKVTNNKIVNNHVKEDSVVINKTEDKFITTNTKKTRINKR